MKKNKIFQQGYTLSEMIVAMVLALMICGMVIKLFQNQQKTAAYENAIHNVQENSNLIFQLMSDDLHQAGFFGCISSSLSKTLINQYKIKIFSPNEKDIPAGYQKKMTDDSNALLIQYMDHSTAALINTNYNNQLEINQNTEFNKGEVIIISNCHNMESNRILKISKYKKINLITLEDPINITRNNNDENPNNNKILFIGIPHHIFYYILKNKQNNQYTLHRHDLLLDSRAPDEIAEGVRLLKIAPVFKNNKIQNLNLDMLLQSCDNVLNIFRHYLFKDLNFAEDSKLWIAQFKTSIKIQNK